MLTVAQAARRLSISRGLVYALISERKLAHVRIGRGRGLIRIPEEAIQEYLARKTVPARGQALPPQPPPRLKHLKL